MKRIALRDARKRKGLSQTELANRIGREQSFISKLESGAFTREPSFRDVMALARELGVDATRLRFAHREAIAS